ncbi:MAG: OmpA family protein [Prosthecobacter sp.]
MKPASSFPVALLLAGLSLASVTMAQQPAASASEDAILRRMETELGVDKLPPPSQPQPQALTRGFRTRGATQASPPPPPPAPAPAMETRTGFRLRGSRTRGGELEADSSPVILPTQPVVPVSTGARPQAVAVEQQQLPAPPPITVSKEKAQEMPLESLELPVLKGSETQLDIQFELNSTAYLDPAEASTQIARLAQIMGKRADIRIMVEGHCCDRGDEHHNNVLSCYRADAIAKHLALYLLAQDQTLQNVSADDAARQRAYSQARSRIDTIGFGETDPARRVQPGDSAGLAESKRLFNRRARCRLTLPSA